MVFTPTWEEFRDFPAFISYMEEQGAHHCGVAKVRQSWQDVASITVVLCAFAGHPA